MAGCGGATSSEMGYDWMVMNSGDWGGVMISRDGGETWAMTHFPPNYFVAAFVLTSESSFLAAARAHLTSRDDGGVWKTSDGGATWTRTFYKPVYDLVREPKGGAVLAALPWVGDFESVQLSKSGGQTDDWTPAAKGISWDGRTPFYPTFAISPSGGKLFVGSLTVNPSILSDTGSAVYHVSVPALLKGEASGYTWSRVEGDPTGGHLDRDGMPKDRMALLVHPGNESLLYVAGNAESLAWRVEWSKGTWSEAFGLDTSDGSTPHVDCRRYFWEPKTSSLILLSDGGAWLREKPSIAKAGRWRSLNGVTGAIELVSANWDPNGKRWIGGAQDNSVMLTIPHANATDVAIGMVDGDGTVTAVDSNVNPSRLWGAVENMGNANSDDPGPGRRRKLLKADPEDDCHGFGFWRDGHGLLCPPLLKWFSGGQFAQFVNPWTLHSNDPTKLILFGSAGHDGAGKGKPSGIYVLDVPYSVTKPDDIKAPTLDVMTGDVYALVAGGVTKGKNDTSVLVALNDTHLMHRSAASNGKLLAHPLAVNFAQPVVTAWQPDKPRGEKYVLGPMSHDRTVSLAVSPEDSSLVAVSGWTTIYGNDGVESVWLSTNGGATWEDVGGATLRKATAVIGQYKPSALLLLPLGSGKTALLVGTVHGVFVNFITPAAKANQAWVRLGSCAQFPLVLVAGLSYEPKDDTLIAATMGRGAYVVPGAIGELKKMMV